MNYYASRVNRLLAYLRKPLLVMKLTCLLLVSLMLQLSLASSGQTVTLSKKNAAVEKIFKEIERQTGYQFLYTRQMLSGTHPVSIEINKMSLAEALDLSLRSQPISYKLEDNIIIIQRRAIVEPTINKIAEISVTGKVTDEAGLPIPSVSIKIKGTNTGVQTAPNGTYSLKVPIGSETLIFSSVGFASQEIAVNNRTEINVQLKAELNNLTDVVVIGYGLQRKGDVTSSVASVKAENFVKSPVLDAGQLIQGKVAGLTVNTPSGDPTSGSKIRLRGNNTLFGANADPLVIVDGVPSSLKLVAPEDIESIDVLKDGSAAAIYGVRGTNGVIIVTTKRSSGKNSNVVEYSGSVSTQTIARKLNMLTADDYRRQIAEGTRLASYDLGTSTDWLKEISNKTPITNIHNITFRGGNGQTNYLATVNYRYFNGIFKKSDNSTLTARADINHSMFDNKVKINMGVLVQNNKYTQTQDGESFNGVVYRQALIRNPTSPLFGSDGHYFEEPNNFEYDNPVARLFESTGLNQNTTQRLNSQITYNPIADLKLSALGSYTKYVSNGGYSESKFHISNIRDKLNGYAALGSTQSIDRLLELTAQYSKKLGDHSFTLLGGYSYQDNSSLNFYERNYDFPTDAFGYYNIQQGRGANRALDALLGSNYSETNLIGFFSRLTYSYKDRYLLMASLRREGASQLYGAEKPYGNFPSVSVGWKITNEAFMKDQTIFDDLKLRAGYGVTGNQPNDGFRAVALLGYGANVLSNGNWIQTLVPTQNPNPALRWEEKRETNIGLDFSMYKGRVTGTVDVYNRNYNGLLFDYQVPSPPNLFPSTRANVGTMQNKGIEVLLNIVPIQTKDFEWTTSFNFSTNRNKLVSLSNDLYQATNDFFTTGGTGPPATTFTNIVRVGDNIGDFYGFKVKGVTADGQWIYEGKNGEDVSYSQFNHAFEDKKVLGNGIPKFTGGWNNNFRYKDLDLSITMRGAFGFQILNFQRMYYENTGIQNYNRLTSAYDPVFGTAVLNKNMPVEFNSYYVENGDFWKIDNIVLGYTFNKLKTKYLKGARVYVSSLNTFTITGYKGLDPEVDWSGLAPGNDNRDKYPTARTFTLGFSLNL
ncbi:TonB-linked SusC/RagA family outer membrane protein [Pedobacter alluvionis]|uniref:TonB-linked SusC/RagA family outer membrane protein n=3 Tax=Pedobacter alluvionis TaxID=475253 RepID=A0A497Y9M5_9SPHI|nr:TonB-linked SusC/RagA family outer membrane protein [Pedobacter alluvionis]